MPEIQIEEDLKLQNGYVDWTGLMTEEQLHRGEYYRDAYHTRRGEVDGKYKEDWDYLQKLYECRRDAVDGDDDYPCSFVPLITPTVEGQVASMMESNIDFVHCSDNPGHQTYMKKLDAASEYYRKKSNFKSHMKDFTRYYDLLGNCFGYIEWQKQKSKSKNRPNGFPRITVPPILSVLVDGRIKDSKDLQYAEYIIHEIGYQSIAWAKKEYGEDKGNALLQGYNRTDGEDTELQTTFDDSKTFTLIHVWTRDNPEGNLQLIEMDANGLVLRESDESEPYYGTVDNQYPFFIARMIPQLGKFYGFGDGAILRGMQETVNNLTDELELAARFSAQSKIAVDSKAKMSGDQITSNPADLIICDDPEHNIKVIQAGGINSVVLQTIQYLLGQAQYATRFNEIMTGNQQGSSATATQINSQMLQGSVGIKDKKSDIADCMAWADTYALNLCLEKWDKPFWAQLSTTYSEFIDPDMLMEVNAIVPTTSETIDMILKEAQESGQPPQNIDPFETAVDESGQPIMESLDFYSKVLIGEGMPKGRTDLYNILIGLAQIQKQNPDGTIEPLITLARLREKLEELLGFSLQTLKEESAGNMEEMGSLVPPTGQNPIGGNGQIMSPQNFQAPPENLASTVPGVGSADKRGQV